MKKTNKISLSELTEMVKRALNEGSEMGEKTVNTENLPDEEQTIWIQSETMGFRGLQKRTLRNLQTHIKLCEKILNS